MNGKLVLIGCGPGAIDLMTLRALRRIESADLVLYDRLVNLELLTYVKPGAIYQYVGKRAGDGGRQQTDINLRIREALEAGATVARLKSGDPLIFGRAAEEIDIAEDCGADIEIVPGITSSLAAASDSLITVTERAELQSFIVTTGRTASDQSRPDWVQCVQPGVCVAFYMSVARAWKIQSTLMAAGIPGILPAIWVERAGCDDTRMVSTQLDRLALDAEQNKIKNPAILLLRYPHSLAGALKNSVTSSSQQA
ncbi:MAG: uroporphyrinogen-III C-methyltransferase [Pseudomonadota bacterium]